LILYIGRPAIFNTVIDNQF